MNSQALQVAVLLFAISFAGALLPLYRRWSDRGLHILVSISAGIFLGTIFLHLLPHLAGVAEGEGDLHAAHEHVEGGIAPWIAALGGFLLLFFVEKVWSRTHAPGAADPHTVLWTATYFGLALHSLTTGVALNAILAEPEVRAQFLVSLLVHKATETFSLATVMRLANLPRVRALFFLCAFAALEPAGLLLGSGLLLTGPALDPVLKGFAVGTFLYVAVCDLLPEVFHGGERLRWKIGAVAFGVLLTAVTLPRLVTAGEFAAEVARESLTVFLDLSPWLLLGFLLAGLIRQWLRPEWLVRRFARDDLRSVTWASLIGAPLPLCSCAVVPLAVSLRRSGASKGATVSFLVSTPETGVDSIGVSWALLDPLLTIARPIGAIVSAIASGSAVNLLVRRGWDRDPARAPSAGRAPATEGEPRAAPADACCAHDPGGEAAGDPAPARTSLDPRPGGRWRGALRYAFVDMLDDLAPSLVAGVLIAGGIAALIPAELFEAPLARGLPGMLWMLLLGIPIYVCATASTPIAAALILKGLSPGAALVFLLASPATNLGSLYLLARHLGYRVVAVQVLTLGLAALGLGLLVDQLYGALAITPSAALGQATELPGWLAIASASLLGLLLAISILRRGAARAFGRVDATAPSVAAEPPAR